MQPPSFIVSPFTRRVHVCVVVYFHLFQSYEKSSPGALALELNYLAYESSSFVKELCLCFVFAATK